MTDPEPEPLTPEKAVLNSMPPRVREKVQRLQEEQSLRNDWAARHAPDEHPSCHPDGVPSGGMPGILDPEMVKDGVTPSEVDDQKYLDKWYSFPVVETRSRFLAEAKAEVARLERAGHDADHAMHPVYLDHDGKYETVHAAGGPHYHRPDGVAVYLDAQGRRERKAEYYADLAERVAAGV